MTSRPRILVVDDDERIRIAAQKLLAAEGHRVASAATASEALERLQQDGTDVLLADLVLPDGDGIALLSRARAICPAAEVILITGYGSVEKAVEAMRLGAYDFIQKPLDATTLLKTVGKALEKQRLARENQRLRQQLQQRKGEAALIGDSPALLGVKELIRQIAATDVNVLIEGESGTGKEVVADLIHKRSARCDQRFVKLSCATIPEALLESELFGYERGAFTSAASSRPGKLEMADGGTLLLDEIAEMSPPLQAKLLRVLQNGQFQRLGDTRDLHADFRLLCATHADIPRAITEKTFRQDLYYRINTVQIMLPTLRERREDIPLLAAHFLARCTAEMRKEVYRIDPRAIDQLYAHSWPGNVRELEHAVERAVALASGDSIKEFSFPPTPGNTPAMDSTSRPGVTIPLGTTLNAATQRLVRETIQFCGGNKLRASRLLGIPPRTMYRHYSDAGR